MLAERVSAASPPHWYSAYACADVGVARGHMEADGCVHPMPTAAGEGGHQCGLVLCFGSQARGVFLFVSLKSFKHI